MEQIRIRFVLGLVTGHPAIDALYLSQEEFEAMTPEQINALMDERISAWQEPPSIAPDPREMWIGVFAQRLSDLSSGTITIEAARAIAGIFVDVRTGQDPQAVAETEYPIFAARVNAPVESVE